MAKPDNRADNTERLQEHIDHTIANLHEAETYLEEYAQELTTAEKEAVAAKNARRRESIKNFIAEKKDESQQQEI